MEEQARKSRNSVGVQEAVGSNPAVPTFNFNNLAAIEIPESTLWVTFWVTLPSENQPSFTTDRVFHFRRVFLFSVRLFLALSFSV